jgi:hypothetical protein
LQWLIPSVVAAALIVGLVVYVHHETNDVPQEAQVSNPKAIQEENREANILIGQDQAPHVTTLPSGVTPAVGLKQAVVSYMRRQIKIGTIDGPLTSARCTAASGGTAARRAYTCDVVSASVTYPFDGVVASAKQQITYCKRDKPPVPSMNIPVSARCT